MGWRVAEAGGGRNWTGSEGFELQWKVYADWQLVERLIDRRNLRVIGLLSVGGVRKALATELCISRKIEYTALILNSRGDVKNERNFGISKILQA